jgi:hypothetical protein
MKRNIILFVIIMLFPFWGQAQDLTDALRFSQLQTQGTARAGAMGNAFGALGGDFTSVGINPAGIGLYRFDEITITPKSSHTKTESSYWNSGAEDTDYKFTLNNFSYVSTIPAVTGSELGLISINLGMGYNRLKEFNSNALVAGNQIQGSYLDYFADNANRDIWSDYYEELAWKTDVLLLDENTNEYWHDIQDAGYGQNQRKSISKSGSIDEYSFTIGANFNHKLYIGASFGMTNVYYRESTQIFEVDAQGNIPYFNEFTFNSYLRTYGYGNNFKFGIIYKPIQAIRLGVSIHTPTWYRLHDYFETSMHTSLTYDDGSATYDEYSPYNNYDYRLETPMRTTFSGAFVIAKKGLISIDYEMVNYGNAKLRHGGDGYGFISENEDIAKIYKTAGNIRVGGELMVSKSVSLRAGYEYQQSAFNSYAFNASQPNSNANLMVYSGGIGFKSGPFFADIAYRYSTIDHYDFPYSTPVSTDYPAPKVIQFNTVKNDVLFTLGYKF